MVFALWALHHGLHHHQLISGSWLPPHWTQWAAQQGYGPVPGIAPALPPPAGPDDHRRRPANSPESRQVFPVTADQAVRIHAWVKAAYAAYECNQEALLAWPALADIRETATARFVDAFMQANLLEPEDIKRCPPEGIQRYVTAVLQARQAWDTAAANARAIGPGRPTGPAGTLSEPP